MLAIWADFTHDTAETSELYVMLVYDCSWSWFNAARASSAWPWPGVLTIHSFVRKLLSSNGHHTAKKTVSASGYTQEAWLDDTVHYHFGQECSFAPPPPLPQMGKLDC